MNFQENQSETTIDIKYDVVKFMEQEYKVGFFQQQSKVYQVKEYRKKLDQWKATHHKNQSDKQTYYVIGTPIYLNVDQQYKGESSKSKYEQKLVDQFNKQREEFNKAQESELQKLMSKIESNAEITVKVFYDFYNAEQPDQVVKQKEELSKIIDQIEKEIDLKF